MVVSLEVETLFGRARMVVPVLGMLERQMTFAKGTWVLGGDHVTMVLAQHLVALELRGRVQNLGM